jgi:hypothetical protein
MKLASTGTSHYSCRSERNDKTGNLYKMVELEPLDSPQINDNIVRFAPVLNSAQLQGVTE